MTMVKDKDKSKNNDKVSRMQARGASVASDEGDEDLDSGYLLRSRSLRART